jgi:hypothetical protein
MYLTMPIHKDLIMHHAEIRLRNNLPEIILRSRRIVAEAIKAIESQSSGSKARFQQTKDMFDKLVGAHDSNTRHTLVKSLHKIKACLDSLTPDCFHLDDLLLEAGADTIAYVICFDAQGLTHRVKKQYIAISSINCGRMHLDDIAATVIHETSHIALRSNDEVYSLCMKNSPAAKGLFTPWSVSELVKFARNNTASALINAETISRLTQLIFLVNDKSVESAKMIELFNRSGGDHILAFHRLESGSMPRLLSPELARRNNGAVQVKKINNHLVI